MRPAGRGADRSSSIANASFAVDNLLYHGRDVAVTSSYGDCPGLCVYIDGTRAVSGGVAPLNVTLP